MFVLACERGDRGAAQPGAETARSGVAWGPTTPAGSSTGSGAAPVFASAASGRLTLGWVSAPDSGRDGRLLVQPIAGAPAAAPVELHDPLGGLTIYGEVPPKIAYAPDGALYAAYLVAKIVPGSPYPKQALRFAASPDGGATWDAPLTVTGAAVFGTYDDHALHVAADGTIYLTWLASAGEEAGYRTYFARSSDRGRHWSAPAAIDDAPSCECCRTALTSGPDGTLYVAWRKRIAGPKGDERDIVVARSTDRGAHWEPPVRVHVDAWQVDYCPDAGPALRVGANGAVHVAWWTGKPGAAGTQYARSTDGARTFAAPVPLGLAANSRAAHIQLALGAGADSGLVVAAWDDGTRKVPQVVVRVSRDGGRTFDEADALSASDHQSGYPVVVVRGDSLVVAWQQRSITAVSLDSLAHAHQDTTDPNRYISALGRMQVVTRRGAWRGGAR
jgi:hypothetical protein